MPALVGLAIGALAGVHIATWGMYKDAPHEGFTVDRYGRSIVAGGMIGSIVAPLALASVVDAGGLLMLFALTYAGERAITEFWKSFLREEDQSKYFIPMQLHINGRLVRNRAVRAACGAVAVAIAATLLIAASAFLQATDLPRLAVVALVGSLGGWYSAVGGACKDAPLEGFALLKFFRSPVIASIYAVLLAPFEADPILIAMAALGFTIATLETYKTFVFPTKPRGKFAGKPVRFPEMLIRRRRFVPVYATIWAAIIATFLAGYGSSDRSAAGAMRERGTSGEVRYERAGPGR